MSKECKHEWVLQQRALYTYLSRFCVKCGKVKQGWGKDEQELLDNIKRRIEARNLKTSEWL